MTSTHIVTLRSSEKQFEANIDETVLEAALRAGFVLPYSCRTGSCGTCKAFVASGHVDYGVYQQQALSDAERAQGYALLCRAKPRSDLVVQAREVVAAEGIDIKILPCRVAQMDLLSPDVMGLQLTLPKNQTLKYLPGQYIDILLRGGRRRSFSIANGAARGAVINLHIRRVPGGEFTNHVFTGLKERDLLRFQGPFGTFFLREDSTAPVIFMAGGTGFAPIKAIIEHALASNASRPMHLFWGVRARGDLYMSDLAESWALANDQFQFTPVLSEPLAQDQWSGKTGWVHEAGLAPDRFYFDSFEFANDRTRAENQA
jgi:CDP-4-dehydro-6-deoxyglucose reductase